MVLRSLTSFALLATLVVPVAAHHPERECQEVRQRVDVIGPLGNRLPVSYRRDYNRPRNLGGKIAYYVAPTSQEAMAWHHSKHRGHYKNHSGRATMHYFSPKPWEALRIGARPRSVTENDPRNVVPKDSMALPFDSYQPTQGLSDQSFEPNGLIEE